MEIIILGVSGSIAAYKAADIASGLVKKGFDIHTVLTKNAASFITPLTFKAITKNFVYIDVMQENDPSKIIHVELPQKASLILIAPATANVIGKIANGIADDMLTSMILAAHDIPILIAPAMNSYMYENPAVQKNLDILKDRGFEIIEPRNSTLACGYSGKGALQETGIIIDNAVRSILGKKI